MAEQLPNAHRHASGVVPGTMAVCPDWPVLPVCTGKGRVAVSTALPGCDRNEPFGDFATAQPAVSPDSFRAYRMRFVRPARVLGDPGLADWRP
jgi:hypothetical protein